MLEGINRIAETKEWISKLKYRITVMEENKDKRMKRIKNSLRDLRDKIKSTIIWIIGAPEQEESETIYE